MNTETLEQILDLARWAPSGDNAQPWRFEIAAGDHLVVHGFDTRKECVYDMQGHASHIALGALLENIAIAASGHALHADISLMADSSDEHPLFDVRFTTESGLTPDPLIGHIRTRSVQRRPYGRRALTEEQKNSLRLALGQKHDVVWLEGNSRMRMAGILSQAGKLRLTIPEAYQVHKKVIAWHSRYSEDRVPDQAIGLDRLTLGLMKKVMSSWKRVEFFNTFLMGTLIPRIELDIVPALACAAHFVILARRSPNSVMDYAEGGRAVQRFWLTADMLGLQLQPEMSPLIFRNYAAKNVPLSVRKGAFDEALSIGQKLDEIMGGKEAGDLAVFMGRVGHAPAAASRSLRLGLDKLKR